MRQPVKAIFILPIEKGMIQSRMIQSRIPHSISLFYILICTHFPLIFLCNILCRNLVLLLSWVCNNWQVHNCWSNFQHCCNKIAIFLVLADSIFQALSLVWEITALNNLFYLVNLGELYVLGLIPIHDSLRSEDRLV